MTYSLRKSNPEDQDWMDTLRREVYRELFNLTWGGWDEERHRRHFSGFLEDGHIQIVEISNAPVGVMQVFETENEIKIGEIQISPAFQGQGLGSKLIADTLTRAEKVSKNVSLATGLKNHNAINLYKKLGFQETNRTETHVHMVYAIN